MENKNLSPVYLFVHELQQSLNYPSSLGPEHFVKVWIIKAHSFIYRASLNCFNRTYILYKYSNREVIDTVQITKINGWIIEGTTVQLF